MSQTVPYLAGPSSEQLNYEAGPGRHPPDRPDPPAQELHRPGPRREGDRPLRPPGDSDALVVVAPQPVGQWTVTAPGPDGAGGLWASASTRRCPRRSSSRWKTADLDRLFGGKDKLRARRRPREPRNGRQDSPDRPRDLPLDHGPDPDPRDRRELPGEPVLPRVAARRRPRGRRRDESPIGARCGPRKESVSDEHQLQPDRPLVRRGRRSPPVVTGLTVWAYCAGSAGRPGAWRWFAPGPAARGRPALPARRAAAVGRLPGEEEAAGVARLPARRSTSMKINDEVRRPEPLGPRAQDAGRRRARPRKSLGDRTSTSRSIGSTRPCATTRPTTSRRARRPRDGAGAGHGRGGQAAGRDAGRRDVRPLRRGEQRRASPPWSRPSSSRPSRCRSSPSASAPRTPGARSRDIAVRDIVAGPTVFVKNQLQVRGTLVARGFRQPDARRRDARRGARREPVATQQVKVPEGAEVIPFAGLKYIPQTPARRGSPSGSSPRRASWSRRTTRSARSSPS